MHIIIIGRELNTRDITIAILKLTASNAATSGKTLTGLDVMMNDSSLNDVPSGSAVVVDEIGIVVGNVSVVVVVSIGREVGI